MIEVKGLVKSYGAKRAVDGISFTVNRGEILGFLGPNGAGKSTTMKMLTGFIRPDAGTATVGGIDVTVDPVNLRIYWHLPVSKTDPSGRGLSAVSGAMASAPATAPAPGGGGGGPPAYVKCNGASERRRLSSSCCGRCAYTALNICC
jgi:energy-coupling factor transporter ATP-binding protein EcfA2